MVKIVAWLDDNTFYISDDMERWHAEMIMYVFGEGELLNGKRVIKAMIMSPQSWLTGDIPV